ncbi:hypothetical protein LJC44_04115, partial [Parabacteroides sp. OttesenSCG-928-G06]|nr:hypothetical protein [Parabacteroides sp. OttesenSCG-928-G06]
AGAKLWITVCEAKRSLRYSNQHNVKRRQVRHYLYQSLFIYSSAPCGACFILLLSTVSSASLRIRLSIV